MKMNGRVNVVRSLPYLSVGDVLSRVVLQNVLGVSDDHSWNPNGEVLPRNAEKQPKSAFFAIADAFEGKTYVPT